MKINFMVAHYVERELTCDLMGPKFEIHSMIVLEMCIKKYVINICLPVSLCVCV